MKHRWGRIKRAAFEEALWWTGVKLPGTDWCDVVSFLGFPRARFLTVAGIFYFIDSRISGAPCPSRVCAKQQSAMGLSRDKITVCVYKGYIGKGRKEPDPLRAG